MHVGGAQAKAKEVEEAEELEEVKEKVAVFQPSFGTEFSLHSIPGQFA